MGEDTSVSKKKFNTSINAPYFPAGTTSRWNDSPLEVGMEVILLDGAFAGKEARIVEIERGKTKLAAPRLKFSLEDGTSVESGGILWKRKVQTAPIWRGSNDAAPTPSSTK